MYNKIVNNENEKIAIEVLQEFLEKKFSQNSLETEVKAEIESAKDELKYLICSENKILLNKVQLKIKEIEKNLESKKYINRSYPHNLYSKDLKTKINYLNENFRYECQLCKKNNLYLIQSGKVWYCESRYCKGKQFLTSSEMEFLNITYNRSNK
tara:strand:+ start:822 stop:1283 length:462 start_codon:yes stop_codon:yes gene_type:complete